MEPVVILIISLIASAIWLWILYEIIKAATKSATKDHLNFLNIQIRLLSELLIKNGVEKERVKEIIDEKKLLLLRQCQHLLYLFYLWKINENTTGSQERKPYSYY